jgi:hypothetical protein
MIPGGRLSLPVRPRMTIPGMTFPAVARCSLTWTPAAGGGIVRGAGSQESIRCPAVEWNAYPLTFAAFRWVPYL